MWLDKLTLRVLYWLQRVSWGGVRWFFIKCTPRLKLEIDGQRQGVFYA